MLADVAKAAFVRRRVSYDVEDSTWQDPTTGNSGVLLLICWFNAVATVVLYYTVQLLILTLALGPKYLIPCQLIHTYNTLPALPPGRAGRWSNYNSQVDVDRRKLQKYEARSNPTSTVHARTVLYSYKGANTVRFPSRTVVL